MGTGHKKSIYPQGISIITCTNRRSSIKNLFNNFARQLHPKKELIIVVNNDKIPLEPYLNMARRYRNVYVYRLPGRFSLGACLNHAVKKAKYRYIAKFDDDDYYAPYYLTASLRVFRRTGADVIGKRAHYMYLRGSKTLILRFPQDENRPVTEIPGATLVFKRQVLSRVQFPNQSGGKTIFFACAAKGKDTKFIPEKKRILLRSAVKIPPTIRGLSAIKSCSPIIKRSRT